MSELAVKAREEARDKAKRYVRTDPKGMKIDASGYEPPDALDADIKTGMRPLSRRAFKKGGMVEFDGYPAAKRADRIARKSGGSANAYINRDEKSANEERDGIKHVGGFKNGGRPGKLGGGLLTPTPQAGAAMGNQPLAQSAAILSGATPAVPASSLGVNTGGSSLARRMGLGFKSGGKTNKKAGGSVSDGEIEGTRPTGGRKARKDGGRAKGKTNINIVIAPGGGQPPIPPMGAGPVVPPAMPVPPPMPPAGGAPPMMPPAGMPPGVPPMGRKAGGRVYRSPKDMDASAMGGLGRIEKAEIQKHKR